MGRDRQESGRALRRARYDVRVEPRRAPTGLAAATLVFYLGVLAFVTLTPTSEGVERAANWVPFSDIYRVVTRAPTSAYEDLTQLVGNIVLFVPFGWLLPALWAGMRSMRSVVAVGAAFSLLIELAQQFIPGRWTSIDDVVLNTVGAAIGALMFLAPRRL